MYVLASEDASGGRVNALSIDSVGTITSNLIWRGGSFNLNPLESVNQTGSRVRVHVASEDVVFNISVNFERLRTGREGSGLVRS